MCMNKVGTYNVSAGAKNRGTQQTRFDAVFIFKSHKDHKVVYYRTIVVIFVMNDKNVFFFILFFLFDT